MSVNNGNSFHIGDSFYSCYLSIVNHKFRSFLTMLGILIGVFSVVTMFSAVHGLNFFIKTQMEKMGWNNSIIINAGSDNSSSRHFRRRNRFRKLKRSEKPLTILDYYYLKNSLNYKENYAVSLQDWKRVKLSNQYKWIQIKGLTNGYFRSKSYKIKEGRFFSDYESKKGLNVCVIGETFSKKYFENNQNVIGKIISIDKSRYEVIGVLKEEKLSNMFNFNNWERRNDLRSIFIPLATGSRLYQTDNRIQFMYFQAVDENQIRDLKNRARQHLLTRHQMSHDFTFNNSGEEILKFEKNIKDMLSKWNMALTVIATISLIVGGIGLFSTLLISISERMTEIGVRKSIGATEIHIFTNFITEAIVLALLGALIGIGVSLTILKIASTILKISFPIPMQGVALGLGFAFVIGLLSGIYPAIKAAKIDPIRAIFYFE